MEEGTLRMKLLTAILAVFIAAPAMADNDENIGRLRPSLDVAFTAGLTDEHNSVGLAVGSSIALAQFGRIQFPLVGADAGFTSVCRADGRSVVPGANDPCGDHMNGFVQLKGGLGIMFGTQRDSTNRVFNDLTFYVTPTYLVAGPFRGNAGLNFGIRVRGRRPR